MSGKSDATAGDLALRDEAPRASGLSRILGIDLKGQVKCLYPSTVR
jgi:hypothetical protein